MLQSRLVPRGWETPAAEPYSNLRSFPPPAARPPLLCSTLIENTQGNSVSEDFSVRSWPWDMGAGIPINCAWWVGC